MNRRHFLALTVTAPVLATTSAAAQPLQGIRITRPDRASVFYAATLAIRYETQLARESGIPFYSGSITCQDSSKLWWLRDFVGRGGFMVEVFRPDGVDVIDCAGARMVSDTELDLLVQRIYYNGRDVYGRRPSDRRRRKARRERSVSWRWSWRWP